ncbi:pentapeptide repeat-containing protein [Nostoc sp. NZL]|uniref:pentapeptide repeat-containing protein n=1 Tax=Nostoc sp. NZL TaxID=2650612 RepID=UPI0018C7792E|nr:hypothetical protein [Nostoc sp. NZL]
MRVRANLTLKKAVRNRVYTGKTRLSRLRCASLREASLREASLREASLREASPTPTPTRTTRVTKALFSLSLRRCSSCLCSREFYETVGKF